MISTLQQLFTGQKPHEIAIVISGFTRHRTTLIEELTEDEALRLIKIYGPKEHQESIANDDPEALRTWRSNVLTIATRAGIKSPDGWDGFNNWMKKHSKFKKELYKHNLKELRELHKQLLSLELNDKNAAKIFGNKAYWRMAEKNTNFN